MGLGGPPPLESLTNVTIRGNNEIYKRENLVKPFWYTNFWVSSHPPPPSSNTSLALPQRQSPDRRALTPPPPSTEQTQQRGILMSILRVLILNRRLVQDMPKYEDARTLKTTVMLPGQGLMAGLIAKITDFLQEHRESLAWPDAVPTYARPTELPFPDGLFKTDRCWLTPYTRDISCKSRVICAVHTADAPGISTPELRPSAHASTSTHHSSVFLRTPVHPYAGD